MVTSAFVGVTPWLGAKHRELGAHEREVLCVAEDAEVRDVGVIPAEEASPIGVDVLLHSRPPVLGPFLLGLLLIPGGGEAHSRVEQACCVCDGA